MSETPFSLCSWAEVASQSSESPFEMLETESFSLDDKEDFLKLLAEAQLESRSVSRKTSRMMSPAPISHICDEHCDNYQDTDVCLTDVFINDVNDDFILDWSSSPLIAPPKQWRLQRKLSKTQVTQKTNTHNIATEKSFLDEEGILSLVVTNIISLLIGTGIGVLIYKKSSSLKHLGSSLLD